MTLVSNQPTRTEQITIEKGLGGNQELLVQANKFDDTRIFPIGSPHLRTNWKVNNASLQFDSKQEAGVVAVKGKKKTILELELSLFYDTVPTVITLIKVEFLENTETKEPEEKVYILEPITPFEIPGGHSLSLGISFKLSVGQVTGTQFYIWLMENIKFVIFISQEHAT